MNNHKFTQKKVGETEQKDYIFSFQLFLINLKSIFGIFSCCLWEIR